MRFLNSFEKTLLRTILEENIVGSELKEHIPFLYVRSRKATGVGLYVNFGYFPLFNPSTLSSNKNTASLSSSKSLTLPKLKYPVSYILEIDKGQIRYLELVTNGNEVWDGIIEEYSLL